ncbi:MAG: patatin-like phospholipase family protein [Deltaproteobacteria bacterium]|nr:MAG: patatin-like phospholipase family protein [Deltaproteobacteria bacterium]
MLVTISGGVSLGSYEAGALYAMSEIFKRGTPRRRIMLTTGASAGSVNAFTTALSSCLPPNPDPREDPGWKVWIGIGYDALYVPREVASTHVFSDRALKGAAMQLSPLWEAGLPTTCDVVVGATTTRVVPEPIRTGNLGLRRETERFVFRLRGRGAGQPPAVENYVDPEAPLPEPRLPFVEGDGDGNFAHLRALFMASAAFPVAFPPQTLAFCLGRPGIPEGPGCAPADVKTARFIDGGVFDNSPLRLAYRVASRGLAQDGGVVRWRDLSAEVGAGIPADVRLVYVNPSRTLLPTPAAEAARAASDPSLVRMLGDKFGDFIETARSRELYALFEEHEEVAQMVLATARYFPTASGHLAAFLGFFERDFRVFDFYLGMYDAYHELGGAHVRAGWVPADPATMSDSWRPFACMLAVFDGEERLRPACEGDALANFRVLVQVALDRVYAQCDALPVDQRPSAAVHRHCAHAADGAEPPRVIPKAGDGFRHAEGETDFDHSLRLLDEYGFAWRDLGLTPDDAEYGRLAVRRRLLTAAEALAAAQEDPSTEALVLTAGRIGVNGIAYEPPDNFGYAIFGSNVEVGANLSPLFIRTTWLRASLAASVNGLFSRIAGTDDEPLAFDLAGGAELSLLFLTSPVIQPTFGVRAGYRFSSSDDFATGDCDADEVRNDGRRCSQFLIQTYLAASFVERLRLQLTLDVTPLESAGKHHLLGMQIGLGLVFF